MAANPRIWVTLIVPLMVATAIRFLASWRARTFLVLLQTAEIEREANQPG